jgi:hypothetical protein
VHNAGSAANVAAPDRWILFQQAVCCVMLAVFALSILQTLRCCNDDAGTLCTLTAGTTTAAGHTALLASVVTFFFAFSGARRKNLEKRR